MPLHTQILRDGETVKCSWKHFHVAAMLAAVMMDKELDGAKPNDDLDYPTEPQPISPSNVWEMTNYGFIGYVCPEGSYTLTKEHAFLDISDGEVFNFQVGDTLDFWRSSKN